MTAASSVLASRDTRTAILRQLPADTGPSGGGDAERSLTFDAMGGRVYLLVACSRADASRADRDLRLVAGRIRAWAARLTRFDADSEVSALDRDPEAPSTAVGPTLAAVLSAAADLDERCEGLMDITLLEARLEAEAGRFGRPTSGRWWLEGTGRERRVRREGRVAFDLDGVGKGWIADRALALLSAYPAALVDADGDIALRITAGNPWQIAIGDPRVKDADLAMLSVPARQHHRRLGVATSGTSIHRWPHDDGARHHLIDPRTGRSAATDLRQVTVVAESALAAESLAKSAVIAGASSAPDLLERAGALAEVLLPVEGEPFATVRSLEWLA